MLALAYAAAHPGSVGPLVLMGCGTFDLAARARLRVTMEARMDGAMRARMEHLAEDFPDPNERLRALGALTLPLYSCDLVTTDQELAEDNAPTKDHQTWEDMVRLQEEGVYPAAFTAIKTPVLMIHGADDPHPGRMIRSSLEPWLPQLEYRELERCGHYPWLERAARDEFFSVLRAWLSARTAADARE
jgi:pimeloyl-ACP methyl ester carboxylesterase